MDVLPTDLAPTNELARASRDVSNIFHRRAGDAKSGCAYFEATDRYPEETPEERGSILRAQRAEDASRSVPAPCSACLTHYGDNGVCDEGKPLNSPHRKPVPAFPRPTFTVQPSIRPSETSKLPALPTLVLRTLLPGEPRSPGELTRSVTSFYPYLDGVGPSGRTADENAARWALRASQAGSCYGCGRQTNYDLEKGPEVTVRTLTIDAFSGSGGDATSKGPILTGTMELCRLCIPTYAHHVSIGGEPRRAHLGRFEGQSAAMEFVAFAADESSDMCGTTDGGCHYARVDKIEADDVATMARNLNFGPLFPCETREITSPAGWIVQTDGNGFVTCTPYDTDAERDAAWNIIEDEDAENNATEDDEDATDPSATEEHERDAFREGVWGAMLFTAGELSDNPNCSRLYTSDDLPDIGEKLSKADVRSVFEACDGFLGGQGTVAEIRSLESAGMTFRRAGELFHYARNGHGIAFTDDYENPPASSLQAWAQSFGECEIATDESGERADTNEDGTYTLHN